MSKAKIMLVTSDAEFAAEAGNVLKPLVDLACLPDAEKALVMLAQDDRFAAVLSGVHLPGMNGLKFLAEVRAKHPRAMRLMVTADRSFKTAAGAINVAHISKMLPRPCPPKVLKAAVQEAVQKFRQERSSDQDATRDLLLGCARMLVDILELTHPEAVQRSKRIRQRAQKVCTELKALSSQSMDMVILLSHIGCVALPPELLEDLEAGKRPSKEDMQIFYTHPSIAAHLLGNMPRMAKIAEIIRHQNTPVSQDPPLAARILKACIDMDQMELTGASPDKALDFMASRPKVYDQKVLESLRRVTEEGMHARCLNVTVAELEPGMVMQRDMVTASGTVLLNKGEALSEASHLRVQTFHDLLQVQEPICVEPPEGQ